MALRNDVDGFPCRRSCTYPTLKHRQLTTSEVVLEEEFAGAVVGTAAELMLHEIN